jgi:L-rhamnonate dehydratase
MISPKADKVVPQFYPLLIDEPIPVNGKLKVGDTPGFGVELNRTGLTEVKKHQQL